MSTQAAEIRDKIYELLLPLPGFVKVRKVAQRQLQPEETPAITIVRGEETMNHDGDPNVGEPRFMHDATFHISIMRGFDDPLVLDGRSDDDLDLILQTLLTDQSFVAMMEGILSIRKSTAWPQQGDAYYVELRVEIAVQFRSFWEPVVVNDFRSMTIRGPNDLPVQGITLPGVTP